MDKETDKNIAHPAYGLISTYLGGIGGTASYDCSELNLQQQNNDSYLVLKHFIKLSVLCQAL